MTLPILAPKSLAISSGGVPGPSLAPAENSKGVPGPSLAPNPHFFTSLGRIRDRSGRKPESSKNLMFYSHNLQWYIPWPLQGDPPGAKKKLAHGSWSPQGPTRRDDTPPREPPGTSRARKPSFLKVCTPSLEPYFEKDVVFENHQKTLGISLFLRQAPPFGSLNMVSRTLLGPSNFVHACPKHLQGCLKDPPSTFKVVRMTSEMKTNRIN